MALQKYCIISAHNPNDGLSRIFKESVTTQEGFKDCVCYILPQGLEPCSLFEALLKAEALILEKKHKKKPTAFAYLLEDNRLFFCTLSGE
jgi:hypothetical protein